MKITVAMSLAIIVLVELLAPQLAACLPATRM